MLDISASNKDITRIQIIEASGEITFDSSDIGVANRKPSSKSIDDIAILDLINSNKTTEVKNTNGSVSQIIVPYFDDFGARPFSVRYFLSYESVFKSAISSIMTTLLLALTALVVTLVAMTYLVHKSILSPLGRIVQSAREISRGNLSKVINLESKDELGDLASSLNQMTEKLKKNIEDLKQLDKLKDEFIYLASHNLRTPITIIKGYTERLFKSEVLKADERASLGKLSQSTEELEATTESLLNLVALEKGSKPLLKEVVDLPNILRQAVSNLSTAAAAKQVIFLLDLPSEKLSKMEADGQRLLQAFSGLIDNAIKFNKIGGKVIVRLEKKKDKVLVSVEDTGIGISDEEKDLIFKKFHRATDTLTYDYEGIGLGLYLTKLLVESHRGKIWFESRLGLGTTFYVELPIKEI